MISPVSTVHTVGLSSRVLGSFETGRAGPTVILCGGLHGNEPDGVLVAEKILATLRADGVALRGKLVAISGHREALSRGVRFLENDLNRIWTEERIAGVASRTDGELMGEEKELWEILALLRHEAAASAEPIVFLDLHSTSGEGPPFAIIGDTLANRRLAFPLGIPVILGLEEAVDGTLLEFLSARGHVSMCIEGGKAGEASTVERLEAAVWLALFAAGCLDASERRRREAARERLRPIAEGLPHFVEIRHRHRVKEGSGFTMRPGYAHFQPVRVGEWLASDRHGEIPCPEDGFILMPLYQGQGSDGFFIARRVRGFWLLLSRWLRRVRFDLLVALLPGVHRDPDLEDAVVVDPAVARWYTIEIFHLLGYRRQRPHGRFLSFTRRRPCHLATLPIEPIAHPQHRLTASKVQ